MAITATFRADFSSFLDAVDKAEVALVDFSKGASKVESSLNKMVDNFSGRKLIQEATLLTTAIDKAGGVSKLTAKELEAAGNKAAEAAEKMKKLGYEVPAAMEKIIAESKKLESSFGGGLLNAVKQLGPALAATFSVAAVTSAAKNLFDYADSIVNVAEKTKFSTTMVQGLTLAFQDHGVTVEQVAAANEKLSKNLVGGDKATVSALEKMGLSVKELLRLDPETRFIKVADAVGQIKNPA